MVGGYELSLVFPEGTPPCRVRKFFEVVREKERAVDPEWGGRPLEERSRYFELNEPSDTPIWVTRWLSPDVLALLEEDRIDVLFAPADSTNPVIYDADKIAVLLEIFKEAENAYVEQSRKQRPKLWYEGTYIALLEFARDHEGCGVSIPM